MSSNVVRQPESTVYPMLAEMGVRRFHEISHYTLRQDGPKNDVLKVHYKRQKGSLLPVTRKYTFGRSLKTIVADGGTARMEDTYEISPYLLDATAELDRLVDRNRLASEEERRGSDDAKSRLLADLDAFRTEYATKLPEADAATFSSRLYRLEERLEAL